MMNWRSFKQFIFATRHVFDERVWRVMLNAVAMLLVFIYRPSKPEG